MSALGFSFISSNETENIEQPTKKRNCTLRKKRSKSKIDNLLNSLSAPVKEGFKDTTDRKCRDDDDDDCDGFELEDFKPIKELDNTSHMGHTVENDVVDDNVTRENFAQLGEVTSSDYYKQYVPNYSQMHGTENLSQNKDALMTKLNYMIHLLEEQQDEKTDNVTEELVLYLFLGVFVIFVVDSFARAGKYTR
jgi:hypothetical protein